MGKSTGTLQYPKLIVEEPLAGLDEAGTFHLPTINRGANWPKTYNQVFLVIGNPVGQEGDLPKHGEVILAGTEASLEEGCCAIVQPEDEGPYRLRLITKLHDDRAETSWQQEALLHEADISRNHVVARVVYCLNLS